MSLFQLLILVNGFDQVIPLLSIVPMTLFQIVISLRLLKPLKAKVFIVDTVLFHIFTDLELSNPWNAPVSMTDIVVFHILNRVKLFSPLNAPVCMTPIWLFQSLISVGLVLEKVPASIFRILLSQILITRAVDGMDGTVRTKTPRAENSPETALKRMPGPPETKTGRARTETKHGTSLWPRPIFVWVSRWHLTLFRDFPKGAGTN